MDGVKRKLGSQLARYGPNARGRQAVLSSGEAPHDELEQPRRHAQLPVEEDASQEGPEEPVYDGVREALCLR